MRHLFILFTVVFLLFNQGKCQIKIAIIDSVSKQSIVYATIYQFSSRIVILSKKKGETELKFFGPDTVKVSYAGYYDKLIRVERSGFFEVALVKNFVTLPEVVIKQCTKWSKAITYKFENESESSEKDNWANMGGKGRLAMFLHHQVEKSKLLSITLHFGIGIGGTREAAKAPIRISFYSVDTSTMLPSNLLSLKSILFHPKGVGLQQINIDSIGLMIPEQGMYIALESYQDEEYGYSVPIEMPNGSVDTVRWYGASLNGIYTKESWMS
jgi:hypothetical protein